VCTIIYLNEYQIFVRMNSFVPVDVDLYVRHVKVCNVVQTYKFIHAGECFFKISSEIYKKIKETNTSEGGTQ